ncbi:MAG: hypothetical protein KIG65_07005 [Eubacteriales bacterium]|nr:hypothetical protein [Eubacteriales bacterium]
MDFKNISKKYRPIPFWSWNEKLDTNETKEQIRTMDKAGIGGFFMHARGGLQTEYMGDEWFQNVQASIDEAKKTGMSPWAYDENGWPSGFGNGIVNGLGVEYQQKYLRMETDFKHKETAICKCGEHYFYYEVNPFYVDTLDKNVIAKFIDVAYKPYYKRYGKGIEGFFTDEPQVSRDGIPWSFTFEKQYAKRYGENIKEHLEELFVPVNDYKNTRIKFWKMVTDLFSEAYMKQIYEVCKGWGLKLTGHISCEDSILMQISANGSCMPHYEYMDIPGMDWLGRDMFDCITPIQLGSAAAQMGKETVLSETFGLCGHNVSFAELKGIYEWQMVRGINLLCQHLEGYSIRGIRKRDYPPAMYIQQPWWSEYEKINDALSRIGMILAEGKISADVLVIHPLTTAWTMYDNGENKGIDELETKLINTIKTLEAKHILFHLGDETLMERHARVEDGKMVVGKQRYSYVVYDCCEELFDNTKRLLEEFTSNGGRIITSDELNINNVVENGRITYAKRSFDNFDAHYFVNTSPNRETAVFNVNGKVLDIYTGELKDFAGKYEFEPWGSLMVIEDGSKNIQQAEDMTIIKPYGRFRVVEATENSLTLDKCDYYFDGELQEKNGYVLNIAERANALERTVQIHQDYFVKADYLPKDLFLVCETPEIFTISINGVVIDKTDAGYFRDKSFRKIEISQYMKLGENTISFDSDFKQSDEFYENHKKAYVFESEKNKLVYDMEIEAVYLVGDFIVRTDGEWIGVGRDGLRYKGEFVIDKPARMLDIKHIEKQGYPFFCGEITLEGTIDVTGNNPTLELDVHGVNAVKVEINGITRVMLTDNRLPFDIFNTTGKTKIRLTLINNLRNLLGPHHLKEGEAYMVGPGDFFQEECVWNRNFRKEWDDDYCFVNTGI